MRPKAELLTLYSSPCNIRYPPSYPLLCLAAQYSQRAYSKPSRNERETHVEASWRLGTKAMVIQSVPIDERNLVIFAIRGTQTFMDWAINLNSAPVSPEGFLVSLATCRATEVGAGEPRTHFSHLRRMMLEIYAILAFYRWRAKWLDRFMLAYALCWRKILQEAAIL